MLRQGGRLALPKGWLVRGAPLRPAPAGMRLPGGPRREIESTSSSIWKTVKENKRGLSKQLDSTMHDGSHDMKAFGMGFLRSISSREELVQMTASLYCAYKAMEIEFDALISREGEGGEVMASLWKEFGPDVRRAATLAEDLKLLGVAPESVVPSQVPPPATTPTPTPRVARARTDRLAREQATQRYVDRIHACAKEDPELLVGHFYTRYFADLFGGSMQGFPTRMALGLGQDLAFYDFPAEVEKDRRAYIERIYGAINAASEGMERGRRARIVDEARGAFRHNAEVFTERPHLVPGMLLGVVRVGAGLGYGAVACRRETREWLGKLGVLKPAAS